MVYAMKRRIGNVDLDTGEVLEGSLTIWNPPVRLGEPFCMMFQQALSELIMDKTFRLETLRVFNYLISVIDYENKIPLMQKDMAINLGMSPTNMSRCIKDLLERGIIDIDKVYGRTKLYRMNNYYSWRGKVKNLIKQRKENRDEN